MLDFDYLCNDFVYKEVEHTDLYKLNLKSLSDGEHKFFYELYDPFFEGVEDSVISKGDLGVEVPHTKGVLGHSDGDVLLHAITDAIIGALGLGDIGLHFPDNDENLKDIDSAILLKKINNIMKEKNYKIVNLDSIIVIQKPKLRPYIDSIRDNIAKILEIDSELINVKAKTEEKLGFTGDETGVKSYCVVLLEKEKC